MNFELLIEIYNLRSELVHGSKISYDNYSEECFVAMTYLEKIVRRALLEYVKLIDSGLSKKQIIKQLDGVCGSNGP